MALAKKYRIPRGDLTAFFQKKFSSRKIGLFLVYFQNNEAGKARFAVSVAKKNYPKAVTRSRIKRVVVEAIRRIISQSKMLENWDYVIIPRGEFKKIQVESAYQDLSSVVRYA